MMLSTFVRSLSPASSILTSWAFFSITQSVLTQVSNPPILSPSSTPPVLPGLSGLGASNSSSGSNSTVSTNPTNFTNPGTNLRIPTDISLGCQNFLAQLNSNPNITSCTAPLLNATISFKAGPKSVTHDQVKATFDGLCGSNSGSGCAPHMMYTILNQFTASCNSELATGVQSVKAVYDTLYILTPYRVALCSKDPTTGNYCPSVIASAVVNGTSSPNSSKSANMTAADFGAMVSSVFGDRLVTQLGPGSPTSPSPANSSTLQARALHSTWNQNNNNTQSNLNNIQTPQHQNVFNPNQEVYTNTNLAFLFLNPYLPNSALCMPCSQSVMAAYIGFEQAVPHYGGLASSGFLSGQLQLWQSISSRCGRDFIEAINQEAGIMSILTSTSNAVSLVLGLVHQHFSALSVTGLLFLTFKLFNVL